MPLLTPIFVVREVKPARPLRNVYAGAAPTTGQMSDFVDATRLAPNRRRYWRARSLLGGEIDTPPHDYLLIEAQPHCTMKYNIAARHAWSRVDASIGLRVRELDANGNEVARPVDWWLTLWNRTEFNSAPVSFRQQNPVRLRDRVRITPGMRYEISVKCRAGAGATGRRGRRQSWAVSSLFVRLGWIWYDFA